MERGGSAPASRRNGRSMSNELHVDRDSRKPLFSANTNKTEDRGGLRPSLSQTRRAKSDPEGVPKQPMSKEADVSEASILTPGGSHVPRLNVASFRDRRPISLSEAFKLAQEEEEEAERERQLGGSPSPAPRSWRAKSGMTPDTARKGNEPLQSQSPNPRWPSNERKTGASLQDRIHEWRSKSRVPDLAPGIDDPIESPEKTFTWQIDQDFTAGDLQVSDSPRIKLDSNRPFAHRPSILDKIERRSPPKFSSPARNSKLDEIRAREASLNDSIVSQPRTYNKLDEIRAREAAVEKEFPIPARQARTKNTKLDEIRQREEQGPSRREIAAARLAEIKERNAQARPVVHERPITSNEGVRKRDGQHALGTPATIHKDRRNDNEEPDFGGKQREPGPNERELLRRLARATSVEDDKPRIRGESKEPKAAAKTTALSKAPGSERKPSVNSHGRSSNDSARPTVGFSGLRRASSTDSAKSKRSSMHSEMDPTARIEAEMKLFAPADNYSERGSIRAPSPVESEDEMEQATPKPDKKNMLEMPTPRVTGAFVETPITIKVEKPKADTPTLAIEPIAFTAEKKRDQDSASEPPGDADRSRDEAKEEKRSKSVPRPRPALQNSAKLPSAKDDLLQLQKGHGVDDWTVDDIEKKLDDHRKASEEAAVQKLAAQIEQDVKLEAPRISEDDKAHIQAQIQAQASTDKEAYLKMGTKVNSALVGLRSTDTRLQKLEDSFAKQAKSKRRPHKHIAGEEPCADCMASSPIFITYMHLPFPKLFSRAPQFRLTLLGVLVALLSVWFAAESSMCAKYCRPTVCSTTPCVYNFDDPQFGVALPVKLDQWTTGGTGRTLAAWVIEEVQDRVADIIDVAHGRSATDVPVDRLSSAQRRRHRRRLQKRGLQPVQPTQWQQPSQAKQADDWQELGTDDDAWP